MKNNKATTIANHIIKSYSTTTSSTKYSGTWVDPTAKIGRDCKIAHGVVIEKDCLIEDDVVIEPNSVVSTGVRIGRSSRIGANSVLANCTIGSECYLYSGVRIGQDGFGFIPANPSKYAEDNAKARPQKKPQMLKVIIHNRVEIGSNTCIDRGSWRDTEIKSDTKIDNLCQVGHNVIIGNACLIAAQVGIAGSCTIGNFVMVGGQSGIAQHLKIGNMARIAAKSGVTRHVADNVTVGGSPALPIIQHHRQTILLRDLEQSLKHLRKN